MDTCAPDYLVLSDCSMFLLVAELSDCSGLCACLAGPAWSVYSGFSRSRTSTPTYELLLIDTDVAVTTSLGAAAAVPPDGSPIVARFEPLYDYICQSRRIRDCRRSRSRRIMFGRHRCVKLLDSEGEAESFHSTGVSPATSASMSITHCTVELQLLSPPPGPLPSSIQVKPDPGLLLRLATAYYEWLPQPLPYPVPISSPSLFREGPFDAATCTVSQTCGQMQMHLHLNAFKYFFGSICIWI